MPAWILIFFFSGEFVCGGGGGGVLSGVEDFVGVIVNVGQR